VRKILLLSDTHHYIDDTMIDEATKHDEIWHAGDWGNIELYDQLSECGPVKGVYGNIDGGDIRTVCPKHLHFTCEGLSVYMTHIAGYPNRYKKEALEHILEYRPQMVVCGHSHILKVMYDDKLEHLHLNPGAMGKSGFHKVRTMLSFVIDQGKPAHMKVLEYTK